MKNLDRIVEEGVDSVHYSANNYEIDGNHYKEMPVEPWDVMKTVLTPEEWIGYLKGASIKYAMRAGKKAASPKDKEKFEHYRKKLREELYGM